MPNPFAVHIKNEFYIAIGKKGLHSFLMLGVVKDDGSHQLLARVGKTNYLDPDFKNGCTLMRKTLCGNGSIAVICDENIFRSTKSHSSINYQAYSLNIMQVIEFLALIHQIEEQQLKNPVIQETRTKLKTDNDFIECYVPIIDKEQQKISFEFKSLRRWAKDTQVTAGHPNACNIAREAQNLHSSNTCRTTSLSILEGVLGFKTDVSPYFFISPKYQTHLSAGQPTQNNFYILPPPPEAYVEELTPEQLDALQQLYQRLEVLPASKTHDPKTLAKFTELKAMYIEIAGQPKLGAGEILASILTHEAAHRETLYAVRSPNCINRFFSMRSTTEQLLGQLKHKLGREADQQPLL